MQIYFDIRYEVMRLLLLCFIRAHTLCSGMLSNNKQKLKCDKCEYKANIKQDKAEHLLHAQSLEIWWAYELEKKLAHKNIKDKINFILL